MAWEDRRSPPEGARRRWPQGAGHSGGGVRVLTPLVKVPSRASRWVGVVPRLHLPADHSPDDIVLAHRVAVAVDSEELFVTWSRRGGAGQPPAVSADVREEPSVVVEAIATVLGWLGSVVDALAGGGARQRTAAAAPEPRPRRRQPPRSHPAA